MPAPIGNTLFAFGLLSGRRFFMAARRAGSFAARSFACEKSIARS